MRITSPIQNSNSNYTKKPSFGCERCNVMLNTLEAQNVPRRKAINWLDNVLNHNMQVLAKTAKEVFQGDETAIQEAVADHASAVDMLAPAFKRSSAEIANALKENS